MTAGKGKTADAAHDPVRWGVLGVAEIATTRVIPAMQKGKFGRIEAIASRNPERARAAAKEFAIPRVHGSYEALLEDPDIEAVYIPLPNHLHCEWSAKALRAGKHVLCEKPLTMTAEETRQLIALRDRTGLCIEEAFMVCHHPQWERVREMVSEGVIGQVRMVQCAYSYTLANRADIRFRPENGGGTVYDVGCYTTTICRLVFDDEPSRVVALAERDAEFAVDRLTTAILDFPGGQASFTASFAAARYQHTAIIGTTGWISADYPFAHAIPAACQLSIGDGTCVGAKPARVIRFDPVNQYTLQGDRFSRLVRGEAVRQRPLETALGNMLVIEALHRSMRSGRWETV